MLLTEYNEAEVMEAIKEEAREEGVATGRTQGETKLADLIAIMSAKGDFAGISRIATDPSFREEMYKKHGIK